MASIKEIAEICGVSVATVSKALNDKGDISDKTKQMVKEKAKELGYFPQYYAKAMRMNRSFNLGVLFVDKAMSGLTHDYFANILNSFKDTAEERGYDITFINCHDDKAHKKTYLEHCRYRGLDGVVIACIDFEAPEVIELVSSDIPVVTIDKAFNNRVSVLSDNSVGMRSLVEYIISMGHKKIAYIYGENTDVTAQRRESYEKALKFHNISLVSEYYISSQYRSLQKAAEYTKELMKLPNPPTCIIYPDDYSSIGGINELRKMGLKIPDDISVAGYDDIFIAGQLVPRLTTVHQDTKMIGWIAANKLIEMIEGKSVFYRPITVKSKLMTGETVADLNIR
ncbi:MAG: LacI family DNA-binding transcriptional regulator [Lachnospiraceae bacterium]|jgi:LacI family transcriptional regulator|nr:LacI family DNA-binding transcriptional regulator [Lachnospiraceae bacterium]